MGAYGRGVGDVAASTVCDDAEVVDLDALRAEIRMLAAHLHAGEARLAGLIARLTADGRWNASGDWRSVSHWLTTLCGFTESEARSRARVAAGIDRMPTVMAHAARGEVSVGVAAMCARVATPEIDATLANIVTTVSPPQASRLLAQYRTQDRQQNQEAEQPDGGSSSDECDEGSWWRQWFDDAGMSRVNARMPADVGALLAQAYAAAQVEADRSDTTGGDPNADQPGGRRPGVVDVVRSMAELALERARATRLSGEGGEHFLVQVLVDLGTLVGGELGPASVCKLASGPDLGIDVVRRLAAEGRLQMLWHRDGIPLKLGTEVRLANRHQRRALRFRDGGCSVPGCGQTRRLHAHHVVKFPDGPTDVDNLVFLCAFHHRRVHHGGWTIRRGSGGRFEFYDHKGRRVGPAPPGGEVGDLRDLPEQQALDIDASTPTPVGIGQRVDDFAADVYLHALLTAA